MSFAVFCLPRPIQLVSSLDLDLHYDILAPLGGVPSARCATTISALITGVKVDLRYRPSQGYISENDLTANNESQSLTEELSIHQGLMLQVETMMQALTDKATGFSFNLKLDESLYLVGVGIRKKSILNIYAVAMYASPSVHAAISEGGGQSEEQKLALRDAARTFDYQSSATSFVLSMVYKADVKTIAAAIADGVKPRYSRDLSNVQQLESLISEGV